jgi:thiamine-monophosphate kinase
VKEALILAEAASPSAMIDVSDGLSSDLGHILEESGGLGAELDADAIPIHPDAVDQSQADGISPLDHALHDGEDFELCLTVEPELAAKVLASPPAGVQLHRLGVVAAEPGIRLRAADGRMWAVEPKGFDHLADGNP